jgi:hypothetical protein
MALVMALAVMLVLTILVTSTLAFTSSNSRDASLKQQTQSAYALAEAGLNAGLAELYSHYYNSSGSATNNATLYNPAWFTAAGVPSSQHGGVHVDLNVHELEPRELDGRRRRFHEGRAHSPGSWQGAEPHRRGPAAADRDREDLNGATAGTRGHSQLLVGALHRRDRTAL